MELKYSKRVEIFNENASSKIMNASINKNTINFSSGMPIVDCFPVEEFKQACSLTFEECGRDIFQYTTPKGYNPLREKIAKRMNGKFGNNINTSNIVLTSGSQQGLDLVSKVFLDKDDIVVCEKTTYVGALNVFRQYGCNIIGVESDDSGILLNELEDVIKKNKSAKLIYVIPDFQNPSGSRWSTQRREEFIELINKYEIVAIEDSPYYELNYSGEYYPMLTTLDTKGLIVNIGTFSKILCPGIRIGWIISKSEIINKIYKIKQISDLSAPTITQYQVNRFLEIYNIDIYIDLINKIYKNRRNIMIEAIEKNFRSEIKYIKPEGGLFIWMELPENMDAKVLLSKCLKKNVSFEIGELFFTHDPKVNTMRLSFSNTKEERIVEGIRIIGDTLNNCYN